MSMQALSSLEEVEMRPRDRLTARSIIAPTVPGLDAALVHQLREGDAEAGRRFVRDYYPGVYRYLLYLTGRREAAEDLTQETFVQVWRRLETFDNRGPLKPWLHRIAHREFLQALRSQHVEASLEEIPEAAAPQAGDMTGEVELRAVMARLSLEARQVIALHYLEGYSYQEIARILGTPVSTVKFRLAGARATLLRELGEGDLSYLNGVPEALSRRWSWLPLEAVTALEARLSYRSADRKVGVTAGRPDAAPRHRSAGREPGDADRKVGAAEGEQKVSDDTRSGMSRRQLLEAAGTAAAVAAVSLAGPAAAAAPNEAEIIDERLTRKVTLAVKATALADLCEQLRRDTGIEIAAGASVADEKVTLFCEKLPLREVMRQLSRPFGYTWLRSGTPGQYRYELIQDLRSQLLEEELRNRDRNEALLALEAEIEKYRPYLDLSPDEVLARAQTAPSAEKKILESLGGGRPGLGLAWGVTQMYFRLTPQELAALRAGEELRFSQEPQSGEKVLPADVARGVLQSLRPWRVLKTKDGYAEIDHDHPEGIPLTAVPEARALVNLTLKQTELGQFGLGGLVGYCGPKIYARSEDGPYAVGVSPRTMQSANAVINAKFARDPDLHPRVTVTAVPGARFPVSSNEPAQSTGTEPKATTADVLEALHRATGMPIVADFYTRLYQAEAVSVQNQPIFDALNHLGDTMGLRWNKEASGNGGGAWLQFRSMTYYHDRLKEVPNRLLTRWSAARRQRGSLTLEELVEIAQLPDAQLDASSMAEGVREIWGLPEWDLARSWFVLANLRFLAQLTPAQREEVQSTRGLLFTRMTLAQQQAFFNRQLPGQPELHSLEELAGTALRVDYTQPGWFQWEPEHVSLRWAARPGPGREGKWLPVPAVRERTREAALQALRRIDPTIRAAVRATEQGYVDRGVIPATSLRSEEAQIVPTRLDVTTIYIPGTAGHRLIFWRKGHQGVSDLD